MVSGGAGEFATQLRRQGPVVVAQVDRADAALRASQEQPPDRAVDDRVADDGAARPVAVRGRTHPEVRRRCGVEGRARAPSGVVHGGRHGVGLAQPVAQPLDPLALGVLARAHPDDPPEGPLEVVRAPADATPEFGEGRAGA